MAYSDELVTYRAREKHAHQYLDLLGAPRNDPLHGHGLNVPARLAELVYAQDKTKPRVWEATMVTDPNPIGSGDFVEHYADHDYDPEKTSCGLGVVLYAEDGSDTGWYLEHGFEPHEYIALCDRCGVIQRLY